MIEDLKVPITTIKETIKAAEALPTKDIIKANARARGINLSILSKMMGMSRNFLSMNLRNKSLDIYTLLTTSYHLDMNLLEPYVNLLPDHLMVTNAEQELRKEIDALRQVIAERERDIVLLKEIISLKR